VGSNNHLHYVPRIIICRVILSPPVAYPGIFFFGGGVKNSERAHNVYAKMAAKKNFNPRRYIVDGVKEVT